MQTKQQIQQILASVGAKPDKQFGQNFLIDINLIKFLLDKAQISKTDTVFEIGCGTGTLTEGIAELAGQLVAVEYDKLLYLVVSQMFKDRKDVTVINGDALNGKNAINRQASDLLLKSREKLGGRIVLVANLPYNIAASAMINLVVSELAVDAMYVTIQKEVAQRMAALPGDSLYGTLSVIMGAAGKVKILKKLPPDVFWPCPSVDSAMVEFVRDQDKCSNIDSMKVFKSIVSLFIGYRRKMLKACTKFAQADLASVDNWDNIFQQAQIDPKLRAEKLSPEQFVNLSNIVNLSLKEGG